MPLGLTTNVCKVIQPVVLGTWRTRALVDGVAVLTVAAIAAAGVARPMHALDAVPGLTRMLVPLPIDADTLQLMVTRGLGVVPLVLGVRRGPILERHGTWNRLLA